MLKRLALALCAGSLLTVAATAATAQEKKPFRVAAIFAKTGVLASVVGPGAIGFDAYIDQVNKAGGVHGRQILVERYDEQSTPAIAAGIFQRVLSEPPQAMVFFGQSTSLTQSRQMLLNAGMPILTIVADDSFLYPTPAKTMFMLNLSAVQQANALLAIAAQKVGDLKGKKFATAAVQTTFSDAILRNIEQLAKDKGFTIAAAEKFPAGIPSFASQGANIARANPDAVFILAGNADAPLVGKAISDAGVTKAPIVFYAAATTDEVFQKLNLPNVTGPALRRAGIGAAGRRREDERDGLCCRHGQSLVGHGLDRSQCVARWPCRMLGRLRWPQIDRGHGKDGRRRHQREVALWPRRLFGDEPCRSEHGAGLRLQGWQGHDRRPALLDRQAALTPCCRSNRSRCATAMARWV